MTRGEIREVIGHAITPSSEFRPGWNMDAADRVVDALRKAGYAIVDEDELMRLYAEEAAARTDT